MWMGSNAVRLQIYGDQGRDVDVWTSEIQYISRIINSKQENTTLLNGS